jgi:hypothetical protein
MSQHERPDIGRIAATMSANQSRVVEAATTLGNRVDELIAAATRSDWADVERLGREVASHSRSLGYRVLSGMAERVSEEAQRPDNEVGVKRALIRLIGAHSRAGQAVRG